MATTKTVLTDVRIYAVNDKTERAKDKDNELIQVRTVSVLVKPDQVEMLALAMEIKSGTQILQPGAWLKRVSRRQALKIVRSRSRRKRREDAVRREELHVVVERSRLVGTVGCAVRALHSHEGGSRIRDVGHRNEQLGGAERAQVLRGRIRRVVERFDRLQHLAARIGRDDARLAEHAGNGGGGDARAPGDLVDVGHGALIISAKKCCPQAACLLASATDYMLESNRFRRPA